MNQVLDSMKRVIEENENIVLVSGSEVIREAGMNGVRAEHMLYEIEEKYGHSGEEIVTAPFLTRQSEKFYDYYRDVILGKEEVKLTNVYKAAAAMEKAGKLSAIVTRMVYSAYQKAGCENVIELYGSAEENHCPVCNKVFDSSYIRKSKGVPKCDVCEVMLRPGITLYGEMINNTRLTQAVNAIEGANVLLVVGMSLNSLTWANTLRYYEGDKLILLNTKENSGDERANYRAYGNLSELLSYISGYED